MQVPRRRRVKGHLHEGSGGDGGCGDAVAMPLTPEEVDAYEDLLEREGLEAYFRRHQVPQNGGGDADDFAEPAAEGNVASDITPSDDGSGASGAGAAENSTEDWSDGELDLFFFSLARHSRLRPDLIAEDMRYSKSVSQVVHLIHTLEMRNEVLRGSKDGGKNIEQPMEIQKRLRTFPAATEVSQEWIDFEESAARYLCAFEKLKRGITPSDSEVEAFVSFTDQVLNLMLWLRHLPSFDPQLNPDIRRRITIHSANGRERIKTFAFQVSQLLDLLNPKDSVLSSRPALESLDDFARSHPIPNFGTATPRRRRYNPIVLLDVVNEALKMELVFACSKRPSAKKAGKDRLTLRPQIRTLDEGSARDYLLVWADDVKGWVEDAVAGSDLLQQTRRIALDTLLRSVSPTELLICMQCADSAENDDGPRTKKRKREVSAHGVDDRGKNSKRRMGRPIQYDWSNIASADMITQTAAKSISRFYAIGVTPNEVALHLTGWQEGSPIDLAGIAALLSLAVEGTDAEPLRISMETVDALNAQLRAFVTFFINTLDGLMSHHLRVADDRASGLLTYKEVAGAIEKTMRAMRCGAVYPEDEKGAAIERATNEFRHDPPVNYCHTLDASRDAGAARGVSARAHLFLDNVNVQPKSDGWDLKMLARDAGVRNDGVITTLDAFIVAPDAKTVMGKQPEVGSESESGSDPGRHRLRVEESRRDVTHTSSYRTITSKAEQKEIDRWERIDELDCSRAAKEEEELWALMGRKPPEQRTLLSDARDEDGEAEEKESEEREEEESEEEESEEEESEEEESEEEESEEEAEEEEESEEEEIEEGEASEEEDDSEEEGAAEDAPSDSSEVTQ